MDRKETLLLAAADAMADGQSPFHESFLVEHDVTLDEVYSLSESLSLAAKMLVQTRREIARGGLVGQVAADRIVRAVLPDALDRLT